MHCNPKSAVLQIDYLIFLLRTLEPHQATVTFSGGCLIFRLLNKLFIEKKTVRIKKVNNKELSRLAEFMNTDPRIFFQRMFFFTTEQNEHKKISFEQIIKSSFLLLLSYLNRFIFNSFSSFCYTSVQIEIKKNTIEFWLNRVFTRIMTLLV